jgi:cytidylate kinase
MTREAGTAGTAIAQEAARQLGWQAYDRELLELVAREKGIKLSLLESIDEQARSQLHTFAESFGGSPAITEYGYFRDVTETILLLGAHGRCVIVGRGAAFLLQRETTLRVRLVGERPERVRAVAETRGLSAADAERWVEETDQHRRRFNQRHFGVDGTNPTHYDLVLNAFRWTVEEAAGLIVEAARRRTAR